MSDPQAPLSLPAATITALRARHIAYLAAHLTDDRARGDFVRSFVNYYDHLLERRVRELVSPAELVEGLAAILSSASVRGLAAPVGREIHRRVLSTLRADDTLLGSYVPKEARDAVDALLARADLVPEAVVRRVIEDDVTEDVMRDVLYDALVEFNDSVNPFFAEWGLPGLLKRFMPIGSGTVIKSISAVRSEFDKRLEPEIRKFLLVFARKSKAKIANFIVDKSGDPKFVALRKSVVAFVYEQSLAELTRGLDDAARTAADTAIEHVVLEVLRSERPRAQLLADLEALVAEHGDRTVAELLSSLGVTERPELERIAELLWPHVKMVLESPPARAFYERITWDFYASLGAADAAT